ncbi:UbiD family decarboxylase [Nocardia amikacinitolerans]|uniref:UbiD family decarboxylase n=1 Tax=Nocardia amikacinitolerans TaxID=756689 RepID=UPI0020A573DC|nr:UbiD family decarboxylase [Nocardia amikacinitolerans]MCP2281007.1 4-hydroxy-3-polyprenylbenzoate decarboxylase [Nocardia amikacinitolerans]
MKRFPDLRSFLDALDKLGDVKRINRMVSADLEAAAITRRCLETDSPAPLFESIEGVAPGFRLLGASAALSSVPGKPFARLALALGLPAEATAAELVEHVLATAERPPVAPKLVESDAAPCKQNILLGDEATLDKFPIPKLHQHDGGKYLNTWGIVITRTPDGSWTNWGISRMMMIDGRHFTGQVAVPQHLGLIYEQWAALGRPMPFAIVQGGDPAIPFSGGIPLGDTGVPLAQRRLGTFSAPVDEAGWVGALTGEPVELVKCETVELEVPATAEVVIEGFVAPERTEPEGPFGEFPGYADWSAPVAEQLKPRFTITAITHRDDPIWPIVPEGRPVDEDHTVTGVGYSAEILGALRKAGLPITTVWMPLRMAAHWAIVIVPRDWRTTLPGTDSGQLAQRVAEVLNTVRSGRFVAQVVLFDDDIDPSDDTDLLWAIGTRTHPLLRTYESQGLVYPMLTCYTAEERATLLGSVVVRDALLPNGPIEHSSFAQAYPLEIQQRVLAHWDD